MGSGQPSSAAHTSRKSTRTRRPRTTWTHRHRSRCPNASIREDAACGARRQLPARDFLTVRCERAAHDAQNSCPQPRRCWARVSGARHRRAALIAALTALTLPSTVPRSSPCAFRRAAPATELRRPRRPSCWRGGQQPGSRESRRLGGAAGSDCDPGPAHHFSARLGELQCVTSGQGQTSSARCVKRALWCRSAHHGVRVCQPAA
jgi:hypothetical protein